MLDGGFLEDEVEVAKGGYVQSRELERAQDASLVGMLTQGLYFDRTLAREAEFEERIESPHRRGDQRRGQTPPRSQQDDDRQVGGLRGSQEGGDSLGG